MENTYEEDPVMGDENDPEYRAEMFETFKYIKVQPRELRDQCLRLEYVEWLKSH